MAPRHRSRATNRAKEIEQSRQSMQFETGRRVLSAD
jgi:hypothetical protein